MVILLRALAKSAHKVFESLTGSAPRFPTRSKKLLRTFCCGSGTRTPIPSSRGMCPTIRRTRNAILNCSRVRLMGGFLLPSEPSNEHMSAYVHSRRALAESPKGLPLDEPAMILMLLHSLPFVRTRNSAAQSATLSRRYGKPPLYSTFSRLISLETLDCRSRGGGVLVE